MKKNNVVASLCLVFLCALSFFVVNTCLSRKEDTVLVNVEYNGGAVDISSCADNTIYLPSFISEDIYSDIVEYNSDVKVVKSDNVASVFIETATGSMDEIYADKSHKEPISINVIDEDGDLTFSSTSASISGRGNTTWVEDKKPFALRFEESCSILGMEETDKWVLLSNCLDYTGIRNAIAYELAAEIGLENVSQYQYVDLYLNGEYNGLYLLMQGVGYSIKQGEDTILCDADVYGRVNSMNRPFQIESGIWIDCEYPKSMNQDDYDNVVSYIREVDSVISNLQGSISDIIDMDSWVKKYLIDECLENFDAGIASSYFYWERKDNINSKIYAGPIWDYDNSIYNINQYYGATNNPRILYAAHYKREENIPIMWYKALYGNQEFYGEIKRTYETVVRDKLIELVNRRIDEIQVSITNAKRCDNIRWNYENTAEEIDAMKKWLEERIAFLDSIWIDEEEYHCVTMDSGTVYRRSYIKDGDLLGDDEYLRLVVKEGTDWVSTETGEIVDYKSIITQDLEIIKLKDNGEGRLEKTVIIFIIYIVLLLSVAIGVILRENIKEL